MAQSIVSIDIFVDGQAAADVARRVAVPAAKPREELAALQAYIGGLAKSNAELRVGVGSAAGVAATLTSNVTGANIANAEWIALVTESGRSFKVTGQAGAATSGDGFFQTSGTDNTAATNIRAAFNTLPGFDRVAVLSGGTNALIFTAAKAGTSGNTLRVVDGTANGLSASGLLTGGIDPTAKVTSEITCVFANTDNDDTITIGGVVFTAKTSGASGEGQFNLGSDDETMGDNLLAKIVAHSKLAEWVTGVATAGAIVLTWHCNPQLAILAGYMSTSDSDGLVLTAQPSTTLTLASAQAVRTYSLGAA